jgi:hypothetical protein
MVYVFSGIGRGTCPPAEVSLVACRFSPDLPSADVTLANSHSLTQGSTSTATHRGNHITPSFC